MSERTLKKMGYNTLKKIGKQAINAVLNAGSVNTKKVDVSKRPRLPAGRKGKQGSRTANRGVGFDDVDSRVIDLADGEPTLQVDDTGHFSEQFDTPQSSNIAKVSYDEPDNLLRVTFKDGTLYEYKMVPPFVYYDMKYHKKEGLSVGKRFWDLIQERKTEREKAAKEKYKLKVRYAYIKQGSDNQVKWSK